MVLDADLRRGEYKFHTLEVEHEGVKYLVTGQCDVTEDYPFEAYGCSVLMGDVVFYHVYNDAGEEVPDWENNNPLMINLMSAVARRLNSGNGMDDWFLQHVLER